MNRLAVLVLCLAAPQIRSQTLLERIERLEGQTKQLDGLNAKVERLEGKVDAILKRLDDPFASGNHVAGSNVVVPRSEYAKLRLQAIVSDQPLYVWVGYRCPSSADQLQEGVHCHLSTFQGDATRRVVVAVPNAGSLWESEVIPAAQCSASTLQAAAMRGRRAFTARSVPQTVSSGNFRSGGG